MYAFFVLFAGVVLSTGVWFQCSLACKYVGTFSIAFWACIHACRRGCFRFRLFKGGGTHVRVRKAAWLVHRGGKVCVLSASFFLLREMPGFSVLRVPMAGGFGCNETTRVGAPHSLLDPSCSLLC